VWAAVASLRMSSEEKAAAVKALFEHFDEDGDGFLDKLEYRDYLKVRTPIKLSSDCMSR
jgi:Ca2+-binding EF-hand superfamily protein